MNIFYLDPDPETCARYHCDKHVVKMILETAMILSTVCRVKFGMTDHILYQASYVNHPCTRWAMERYGNFRWLKRLGLALCDEYNYRYGKIHKSRQVIEACMMPLNFAEVYPNDPFGSFEITERPQCMPETYKDFDPMLAYRNYYLGEKTYMLKYTKRHVPDWINSMGLGEHK